MEYKEVSCRVKSIGENGTFEGMLSVYGNVDSQNEVVQRGAFSKSLSEQKHQLPLLWQHNPDDPIGSLTLEDTAAGLKAYGTFALEVTRAREAYALAKRDIVKGLSIGYQTLKDKVDGNIRYLLEVRLFEGSLVTFPSNPAAVVSAVKAQAAERYTAEEEKRIGLAIESLKNILRSGFNA